MSKEIETEYTEYVTCPHCGFKDKDSWEIDFGSGMDGDVEMPCDSCGEEFLASRRVTVRYYTYKITVVPNKPRRHE